MELDWNLGIFVCLLSFSGWSESYPLPFPKARLAGAVYAACTTKEGSTDERRRIAFNGGCDDARLPHPPDRRNLHRLRVSPTPSVTASMAGLTC